MNIYMALYFSPGEGAVSHMGYFSNDYDDVAGRDPAHCLGASPFPHINPTMFFVGFDDPAISAFARAPLERGRTYYWAIDEFDGTTTHAGPVWSFTVMPTKAWNRIDIVLTKCVIPFPVTTIKGDVWSFKTFRTGPAIIYVDEDAHGANNGSSWGDAYKYLRDALPREHTDPMRTPIIPRAPEIARQHSSLSTE